MTIGERWRALRNWVREVVYSAYKSLSRLGMFQETYVRECACGGDVWYRPQFIDADSAIHPAGYYCVDCRMIFPHGCALWTEAQMKTIWVQRREREQIHEPVR